MSKQSIKRPKIKLSREQLLINKLVKLSPVGLLFYFKKEESSVENAFVPISNYRLKSYSSSAKTRLKTLQRKVNEAKEASDNKSR